MNVSYHVAPRFTGGSPALVGREQAETIAVAERIEYERLSKGFYGDLSADDKAEFDKGLAGIVEKQVEYPSKNGWVVEDLCTHRIFTRSHRRPAKVQVGDTVTRYDDHMTGNRVEGSFRVLAVEPIDGQVVGLRLTDKNYVLVRSHSEVTVERPVQDGQFRF